MANPLKSRWGHQPSESPSPFLLYPTVGSSRALGYPLPKVKGLCVGVTIHFLARLRIIWGTGRPTRFLKLSSWKLRLSLYGRVVCEVFVEGGPRDAAGNAGEETVQ